MPANARDIWLILRARDEASRVLRSFGTSMRGAGNAVETTGMRVARTAGQVGAVTSAMGLVLTGAGIAGVLALKNMTTAAVDYEKQVRFTLTQTDKGQTSLKELGDIGIAVGNKITVAFDQIQPALYDIFSSMDVTAKQAAVLLEAFSKAAVAGQTDIESASRATIGILNAFKIPVSDINTVLDKQFVLVKEGIGTYKEWVGRIGQVSPSAVRAGQSLDFMLAALITTTRFGIPAARSATAVARSMDAMSNPKAVAAMKDLGVNAVDATGKFRPFNIVLGELHTALFKLPPAERTAALIDIFKGAGGTIEARKFLQSILLTKDGIKILDTQLKNVQNSSGAFETAYKTMSESVAGKSQLLSNKWQILKITIGNILLPAFSALLGFFTKIVDALNNLSPGAKKAIVIFIAIASGLSIIAGVIMLVISAISMFIGLIAVAGSALFVVLGAITGVTVAVLAIGAAFVFAYEKSKGFRDIISELGKFISDVWHNVIVPFAISVRDAWDKYMQPALDALATTIETRVMPVLKSLISFWHGEAMSALMETANVVKNILAKAFEYTAAIINNVVIPAIDAMTKFYYAHQDTIKQIIGWLGELAKWFLKIGGIIMAVLVGSAFIGFVTGMVMIGAVIISTIVFIVKLVEWFKIVWNWLKVNIPAALSAVGGFFVRIWNDIASFFSGLWNRLSATVSTKIATIRNLVISGWNGVKAVTSTIWNGLISTISSALSRAQSAVTSVVSRIKGIFSGAATWLLQAGSSIVQGLINGISSRVKDVTNAIGSIASKISGFFGNSPAKWGPLAGQGAPYYKGQRFVKELSKGIKSQTVAIARVTGSLASSVGSPQMVAGGVGSGSAGSLNQNFVINTQEIDPRRHAAELGFMLAARV